MSREPERRDRSRTQSIDRRKILVGSGAVIASVASGGFLSPAAAESSGLLTVYQLNPNWGYPRGPRGKTSLESAASQKAAANRFALDPVDAEAMNLHLGSYAPPSAVLVNADSFMQLWNGVSYAWTNPWMGRNVRLLDKRHASLMANGAELLRAALNLDGASTASLALPTPARTAPALAYTGSSTRSTAVAGFGLVTAGAVLVRLAERRSAQQQ